MSAAALANLARAAGHPIYWVGSRSGDTYEVTRSSGGDVYIRYLPAGTAVGDPRSRFVAVGTYPRRNAYDVINRDATEPALFVADLAGGGVAVTRPAHPKSVYVAYPGVDAIVEIYAARPGEARKIATAGALRILH